MKKRSCIRILVAALVFSVCIIGQLATCSADAAPKGLTKITDNVYAYVDTKDPSPATGFGANTGVIIGRDGIVVVDTLISARDAKRFIADIRKVSDKPILYAVNTHEHLDHALGNSEFKKAGAVIVSQADCKKAMEKTGDGILGRAKYYGLTDNQMEGTEVVYPSITFGDRMEIDLGDRKVDLIYPGPSHTDGSLLVYLPQEKVLFTGDVLFTNYHPNVSDGNMESWQKVLDYVATLDTAYIIPGHGPLSSKKDVQDMKDYLVAFDNGAKELCAKSDDVDYIATELKKRLPTREYLDILIAGNIKMRYLKK